MDIRYFSVVLKKVYVKFLKFWFFASFLAILGSKLAKNANFDPKMAKKGAKNKISKIWRILFWGPLRSSLYPKIRLFEQFGLELLHFSWFLRNRNFVSEIVDFQEILVRNVKYFGQISLCLNFFWLIYAKFTGTHKKHHLTYLNHCFLEKGQKWLKNSRKDPQITIEIALYKPYFAKNGPSSKDHNFGSQYFFLIL